MKYKIVTKRNYESEQIEAESPEDAIVQFATFMDMDMNLYFRAIPESEYDSYNNEMEE